METRPSAPTRTIAAAKLHPRLSSPRPVPRLQLLEHLHAADDASLVLVHGPAGFGKTTVMLQYFAQLQQRGTATGWVTLDRADNDLGRFLTYVVEAFRTIDPTITSAIEQGGADLAGDTDGAVLALASHLAGFGGHFTLFMDDFERIESPVILGLVRQLVDYLPEGGQLVIGSRTVPELGLGRLRAHGRLHEIKAAALRFSAQETASFLRHQHGLALRDDHIHRLQHRTEGWPAALWLVSLALRDRGDPQDFIDTFDGSDAAITDYLAEDVLSRQPEALRDFLLRTSVLQDLGAPLCDHLLSRGDSREMLAHIERAHLFLAAQDADRQWFRYHALFRDFLRAQLAQAAGAEVAGLHRRAADWWLSQDQPTRAIEHALQAEDSDFLIGLLSSHAGDLLWQGRARTLARWHGAARLGDRLARYPALALVFAWALTLTRHYDESMKLLDALRAARTHDTAPGEGLGIAADVQRAFILAMTDRVRESLGQWQACLPHVTPTGQPFAFAMLGASYGYCLVAESRFDEARHFLEQARRRVMEIGKSFIAPMALCLQGAIDLAQGRLENATTSFRAALAGGGDTNSLPHAASNTVAAAFLAEALYEADRLDEAGKLLNVYLPLLKEVAAPDQLITSYVVLVRIAAARADLDRAADLLGEMEVTGHQYALPRMVATARLERARLALLAGQRDAAAEQLASAGDAGTWQAFEGLVTHANDGEAPFIANFRLHIRSGRSAAVIAPLKLAVKAAEALRRHRRALKLNILLAEAQCNAGQQGLGMRRLRDALQFAATEGFVRTFIDEGAPLARWVAELRATVLESHGDSASTRALAAFMDTVLGPQALVAAPAPEPLEAAATEPPSAGPLSERELQVLRLLAGGHRNRTIADRLFVSETTVKAHLRSINVKLGTQSRTHAVAVGRQRGLMS
ncbi:ATP-dependent transcriptional activator MalT [Variovorax sp. PBS-H4]|uniref:LuxR C-terminal-related transcriptional regulator n=1 Tax=Variovorax sp. PBS-H4 TaxID=434008 RepID=UPI001316291E|nr:LuxR C-terminal-related transcriptional regulator [Variovorax sp. PBS-H4]VTU37339.1 ATP-dependent transcriptional activator MalT [Variovorax sp. PBS-H4]